MVLLSASNETIKAAFGSTYSACRLPLGKTGAPVEQILLLGYFPGDLTPVPGAGFIETSPDLGGTRQRICGAINHGLSGGPAADKNGDVLGLMRERINKDIFNNEVVEKGFMLPVDDITKQMATLSLKIEGNICGNAETSTVAGATPTITIPYQLSETLSEHKSANGGDIAKWTTEKLLGRNPRPIRYPKSYQRMFPAIPGYKIISIKGTSVASHNFDSEPLPTHACVTQEDCIRISPDGKSIAVDFRLWSGPKDLDETRGWLDMTIFTEQTPIDAYASGDGRAGRHRALG